jgi:hypothetical protein
MSHQRRETLLGDWHRYYPTAKRIAASLLADSEVLNLRTRRLEADVRERFHVAPQTARFAVSLARKAA